MTEYLKNLPGWLVTGVLGGLSVAFVFLIFLPAQRSISETNRCIEAKQAEILAASKAEVQIQQVASRVQKAKKYLEEWHQAAKTANDVLDDITIAITDAGATVERFQPEPGDNYATLATTTVNLEVSGTTAQILNLLGDVEAMPQTVWISHFSLAPKESFADTDETVVAELRLIIFTGRVDNSADVSFSSNR